MEPFELELFGQVRAKKNQLMPVTRKDGSHTLINSPKARESMDSIILQIPGGMRDLNLRHPAIEFFLTFPNARADRDNVITVILDALVSVRVLAQDNVANCNGTMIIHPAIISDHYHTRVVITPAAVSESGHGKRKKRS